MHAPAVLNGITSCIAFMCFLLLCFLCFYCYYVFIDVRLSHLNKDYLLTYFTHGVVVRSRTSLYDIPTRDSSVGTSYVTRSILTEFTVQYGLH